MVYNPDIPGWFSHADFYVLETLAYEIPENGKMVEFGCAFGRSTWAWSRTVHPSVKIYCLNRWNSDAIIPKEAKQIMHGKKEYIDKIENYNFSHFEEYTKDCENLIIIDKWINFQNLKWTRLWPHGKLDLVFDDAMHKNPEFELSLNFWWDNIKPGGTISGHDYSTEWPDIIESVDKFADINKIHVLKNIKGSSIWAMKKPF